MRAGVATNKSEDFVLKHKDLNRPFDVGLGHHIRATHSLMKRHLQEQIQGYGVSIGMWHFLRALWHQNGLTQRELAQIVGTTEPTAMTAIAQMERKGIITRVKNSTDKRRINIYLTERGRSLEAILIPRALEVTANAAVGLSLIDQQELMRMLQVIQRNVINVIDNAPSAPDSDLGAGTVSDESVVADG